MKSKIDKIRKNHEKIEKAGSNNQLKNININYLRKTGPVSRGDPQGTPRVDTVDAPSQGTQGRGPFAYGGGAEHRGTPAVSKSSPLG